VTVTVTSNLQEPAEREPATGFGADGRAAYARTRRRASAQALLLALPLLLFLLATFIAPIAILLSRSVENREVPVNLPALSQALKAWNGEGVPTSIPLPSWRRICAVRPRKDNWEPWRGG